MKVTFNVIANGDDIISAELNASILRSPKITTQTAMLKLATRYRCNDMHAESLNALFSADELVQMMQVGLIPSVEEFNPHGIFEYLDSNDFEEIDCDAKTKTVEEASKDKLKLSTVLHITVRELFKLKHDLGFLFTYINHGSIIHPDKTVDHLNPDIFVTSLSDLYRSIMQSTDLLRMSKADNPEMLDMDITIPITNLVNAEGMRVVSIPSNQHVTFNLAAPVI